MLAACTILAACSPEDPSIMGVKHKVVAFEKLPLKRSASQLIRMNDRIRIAIYSDSLFEGSSAKFRQNYRASLETLETFLTNNKMPNKVIVNGYQSNTGDVNRLTDLSKEQANAVASFVWAVGVPSEKIKVIAHGPRSMVSSNDTASGNVENRRIEVDIF